jgi:exonuclease SbcC
VILKKIALHNFMSYGDSVLDMSSLSIACLSGHNGAGKSAILDAITWALWESARSSSDELIRMGQQDMWVDMTFELEGNHYRVRRSRTLNARGATKSSKGTLDFQVERSGRGDMSEANVVPVPGPRGAAMSVCANPAPASPNPLGWR